MSAAIEIRNALAGDICSIIEIFSDKSMLTSVYTGQKVLFDKNKLRVEWSVPSYESDEEFFFVIYLKSYPNKIIGCARSVKKYITYFIIAEYQGYGYGNFLAKCIREKIEWSDQHAVWYALISRENIRSIKIAEKIGFRFAGISKEHSKILSVLKYRMQLY